MVQHSARGSLILLIGQVLSTVLLAIGAIIVARLLGDFSYGVLTIASIPISMVMLLNDIGVNASLIRYIAQYRSEGRQGEISEMVRAGLILNSLVTGIPSLLTYLFSGSLASMFHDPSIKILIEIGALGMLAQTTLTACQAIFIGFERMELHSLTVVAYALLKSTSTPILVIVGYGVFGATVAWSASFIIVAIVGIFIVSFMLMRRRDLKKTVTASSRPYKMILGYGIPLYLANLLSGGLTQLFNFMMAIYVEFSIVGNYQAALNFSVLLAFLSMPISTVLFPLFSKLDLEDGSPLGFVFQSSIKYSALILVPAAMGLIAVSDHIIRIIYGDSYQIAPFFLQLILVNILFVGLGSMSVGTLINSQGKTRISFIANLIYVCVGLPMGLYMIPTYGIVGLLLTSILASKPSLIYALWWIRKNFGFSVNWASSAKIYISSGLSFIIVYILLLLFSFGDWIDLILGVGVFFVIYSILLPSIGALDRYDIMNLRSIMKALGPLAPLFNMFLGIIARFTRETKGA